jgi:hypothetical protein
LQRPALAHEKAAMAKCDVRDQSGPPVGLHRRRATAVEGERVRLGRGRKRARPLPCAVRKRNTLTQKRTICDQSDV